jgi:hypothetical protein
MGCYRSLPRNVIMRWAMLGSRPASRELCPIRPHQETSHGGSADTQASRHGRLAHPLRLELPDRRQLAGGQSWSPRGFPALRAWAMPASAHSCRRAFRADTTAISARTNTPFRRIMSRITRSSLRRFPSLRGKPILSHASTTVYASMGLAWYAIHRHPLSSSPITWAALVNPSCTSVGSEADRIIPLLRLAPETPRP